MSARVIIVGGGAMGLSTAWSVCRMGGVPIVLERFSRAHDHGASHGATRNFNDAYADAAYLDLLQRAFELWNDLSTGLDESLLHLHGLVTHGDETGIQEISEAHAERGILSEVLAAHDAASRWGGMRFTTQVLFSPSAGVVRAAAALTELERRIVSHGGEVRWDTRVAAIDSASIVTLTDGSTVEGDRVVITAGAWTRSLVPTSIALPALRVSEEHPAHFAPVDSSEWPSFNHLVSPDDGWPANVYGMPTPGEGIKVGFHKVGDEVDPDNRKYGAPTLGILRDYVNEWMPGLDPRTAVPVSCTYTSTASEDFILDRVGDLIIGAGFSGHGFKFVPAVGETLARLALEDGFRTHERFRV